MGSCNIHSIMMIGEMLPACQRVQTTVSVQSIERGRVWKKTEDGKWMKKVEKVSGKGK